MAVDIKEGDILTIGSIDYLVKRASSYTWRQGATNASFSKLATVDCSTKRQAVTADAGDSSLKKRAAAHTANLTGLKCMPLDPVRPQLTETEGFGRVHTIMETFITDSTSFIHVWVEREV